VIGQSETCDVIDWSFMGRNTVHNN